MNVYGLHKKADQSMCTVKAKKLLQNMTAETLCLACLFVFDNKIKFLGTHAVVLVKRFPLAYHLLL